MNTIQEQVKEAYELLKNKKRASEVYGCTSVYFKKIVDGQPKDDDVYHLALQAIKQAASEYTEEANETLNDIEVIGATELKKGRGNP